MDSSILKHVDYLVTKLGFLKNVFIVLFYGSCIVFLLCHSLVALTGVFIFYCLLASISEYDRVKLAIFEARLSEMFKNKNERVQSRDNSSEFNFTFSNANIPHTQTEPDKV